MLVFDASGSMASMGYNGLDQPRIVDARTAMREALPGITPFRRVGLITYGPGSGDACANIELRLPPTPNAAAAIISEIDQIQPAGDTPLTEAVLAAAETLMYREKPGTVVLVTDGKETCDGATCAVAQELFSDGVALTVHVIGFKVRADFFQWQGTETDGGGPVETAAACLSERTGGQYFAAESIEDLVRALQETLGCPILSRLDT